MLWEKEKILVKNSTLNSRSISLMLVVVLGFNATLTVKVILIIMAVSVFSGLLTPVLTTFLSKATDCFSHMRLHR